jgi:hypothetical protein
VVTPTTFPFVRPPTQRKRLRWLIREYGLNQTAAPTGLSPSTVARFVAGDELSAKSGQALTRAFCELGSSLGLDSAAE